MQYLSKLRMYVSSYGKQFVFGSKKQVPTCNGLLDCGEIINLDSGNETACAQLKDISGNKKQVPTSQ